MDNDYCSPDCDECAAADRATASLRTLLASPSPFVEAAAILTVYTAAGTFTVEGVREDSIVVNDNGVLTAEGEDTRNPRIFTFYRVGGYSTVLAG